MESLQKAVGNAAWNHKAAQPDMDFGKYGLCPGMPPNTMMLDTQDELADQNCYDYDAEDLMSRCEASCLDTDQKCSIAREGRIYILVGTDFRCESLMQHLSQQELRI